MGGWDGTIKLKLFILNLCFEFAQYLWTTFKIFSQCNQRSSLPFSFINIHYIYVDKIKDINQHDFLLSIKYAVYKIYLKNNTLKYLLDKSSSYLTLVVYQTIISEHAFCSTRLHDAPLCQD